MSGEEVELTEIRRAYWRYAFSVALMPNLTQKPGERSCGSLGSEFIFVVSAISANVEKQRHAVFGRRFYVDTLKQCRDCGKSFIFFALEQRHWYEVLRFWVDSECVRCSICRVKDQRVRRAQERYATRVLEIDSLSDRHFVTLLRDALFLAESGLLKDESKLRRLKNIALKRGTDNEALSEIVSFLEQSADRGLSSND